MKIFLQYNVAILHYLGLNFRIVFFEFFPNRPWLTNTVKGCTKGCFVLFRQIIIRFIQMQKMLQQLFLVQLPRQILICRPETSRHSPAVEFKLKNVFCIHSLNKTKQLLTTFYSVLESRTICKKIQKKILRPWAH